MWNVEFMSRNSYISDSELQEKLQNRELQLLYSFIYSFFIIPWRKQASYLSFWETFTSLVKSILTVSHEKYCSLLFPTEAIETHSEMW